MKLPGQTQIERRNPHPGPPPEYRERGEEVGPQAEGLRVQGFKGYREREKESGPQKSDWSGSAVLGSRGSWAREFADLVDGQHVGTVLPWTRRQLLVREAQRRGIGRFEANLIIAAVQHQRRFEKRPAVEAAGWGSWLSAATVFVVVEFAIIAVVWHFFI